MPTAPITPSAPTAEHRLRPLGIGTAAPRLSWTVPSAPPGWSAASADVESTAADGAVEIARIEGASGRFETWPFAPLASREARTVRVRVTGADGAAGEWSAPTAVEAGLHERADWSADFVAAPWPEDTRVDQPPALLRRVVRLRGPVASARLYSASLGLHELEIDGVKVGDALLAPGWTSYAARVRYLTADVTDHLRAARTDADGGAAIALGAWLGDGWYRTRLGWDRRARNIWGDTLALLAQLEIRYEDGSTETIGTGADWEAVRGPILSSSIYDGERFDAAGVPAGWGDASADLAGAEPVRVLDWPGVELIAYEGEPVRVTEELSPISQVDDDGITLDFGQNLVGRLRLRDPQRHGQLELRHAEVLEHGRLALRPLRTAEQLDEYTPAPHAGGPAERTGETWAPRFTFHGFRYAEVRGWRGPVDDGDIVAEVAHSDMRRIGWFRCSDPRLERLHENIVWSMRGNFVDVPTDCPQRDERLGWTGDLQAFAPTGAFVYDCAGFLRSWLQDVAIEQRPSGSIPHFVPDVRGLDGDTGFTAVWGDVVSLTPWDLYEAYGDRGMLAEQYPAAKRWVDGIRGVATDGLLHEADFQFGDWLDPTAPPDDSLKAKADTRVVATAYYFRSTRAVADAAAVLGKDDEAREYADLAERIRVAFLAAYTSEPGHLIDDAQTSYALAIVFGILQGDELALAGDRLSALVREHGHLIGTGFAGTPMICDALTITGHLDDAYAMLTATECPSWLYPVENGATTIWERWDSLKPDGRINTMGMTSFNHYALGAVGSFLHRSVAGIAPASPGYERILFRPRPGGGLTSAGADLDTPSGRASIDWVLDGGELKVSGRVPVGATAVLDLSDVGGPVRELEHGEFEETVPVG